MKRLLRPLDDLLHWIDYRRGLPYRETRLCRAWRPAPVADPSGDRS